VAERSRNQRGAPASQDEISSRRGGPLAVSSARRTIRTAPPTYRWECPCQNPPVLLATYEPNGKINIKVRDRYWHLFGFGQVQAICPRCAAEHVLDLHQMRDTLAALEPEGGDH
jgi:hypothetical protein